VTLHRDARRRQTPSRQILGRISCPGSVPDEHTSRTKFPRSAHVLRPLRTLPAPPPGHESALVPRCPWETSSAYRFASGPAGTRYYRRASGSKLQQPVGTHTICAVAIAEPIGSMVDRSAPTAHAANPSLYDFSRQHPSQQSARCREPVPRAQLGSGVSAALGPCLPGAHMIS
jgi:hypothetical protein